MSDADYLLALKLQQELNDDSDIEEVDFKPPPVSKEPLKIKRSNPRSNLDDDFLNRTQNLVHPQWETLDPTPDISALFHAFDAKFFQSRLKCVTLEWSKKMYSCAGICYSRRNRFGMDVTIRLSEPLLKLRPRKDLVETMLHEMIHAYCFVLNIREGNGGHGPNFKRIMVSINKVAGTNITVYHTFHDEVEVYKQHWWRCNGICQNRSPFFGYVKRTSNRAPSSNDQWWAAHRQTCGGTFMKIKEPEKPQKQKSSKAATKKAVTSGDGNGAGDLRPVKSNGGGTMLLNPKTTRPAVTTPNANPIASAFPPSSYPGLSSDPFNVGNSARPTVVPAGGNLRNVKGFRDLNSSGDGGGGNAGHVVAGVRNTATGQDLFGRGGYSLDSRGPSAASPAASSQGRDGQVDRNHLRNLWASRFAAPQNADGRKETRPLDESPHTGEPKRRKISDEDIQWMPTNDSDIMISDAAPETVVLLSDTDDEDDDDDDAPLQPTFKTKMSTDQRQTIIKREILDETVDLQDEDIMLIDDEYNDDDTTAASEIADTSVVDEFFGDDTLVADFERENDMSIVGGRARVFNNPDHDIITCPICQEKMRRCVLGDHLNGCTGIAVKVLAPKHALKRLASTSREVKPSRRSRTSTKTSKDILREAGYSESEIASLNTLEEAIEHSPSGDTTLASSPDTTPQSPDVPEEGTRRHRQRSIYNTKRQCPVCAQEVEEARMNDHLDVCLM